MNAQYAIEKRRIARASLPYGGRSRQTSPFRTRPPDNLRSTPRLTLTRLFVFTTLALALVGGATFYAFLAFSRRSILAESAERRDAVARRVETRVQTELQVASDEIDDLERAMQVGALSADDANAVEARLYSEILDHPTLSDVSVTHAGPGDVAWQVSLFRISAGADGEVWTRRIRRNGELVSELRRRPRGGALHAVPFEREPGPVSDPTKHDTYTASLVPENYGRAIWSDLSYSELDRARPTDQRRVVLTVQKAIEDAPGHLAGVVRAGAAREHDRRAAAAGPGGRRLPMGPSTSFCATRRGAC